MRVSSMIDPASIPQHVVDAAQDARAGSYPHFENELRWMLAAAFDALMDDESVKVLYEPTASRGVVSVRPSDVLEAVLARKAS